MWGSKRIGRTVAVCVTIFLVALSFSARPGESSGAERVRVFDDCEPTSFNAAVGFEVCATTFDGDTTFDEFIAEFFAEMGVVEAWEFDPDEVDVESGEAVRVDHRGGEFHTFTRVAVFGGGFIPPLNAFAGATTPECAAAGAAFPAPVSVVNFVVLPPGPDSAFSATISTGPGTALPAGSTNLFQCCLHPWMRTVIVIEDD